MKKLAAGILSACILAGGGLGVANWTGTFAPSETIALPESTVSIISSDEIIVNPDDALGEIDISELPYFQRQESQSDNNPSTTPPTSPQNPGSSSSTTVKDDEDESAQVPLPTTRTVAAGTVAGNQDTYLPPLETPQEAPQGPQSGYVVTGDIEDTIQALQLTEHGRGLFLGAAPEYMPTREAMQSVCNIDWTDTYRGCYTGHEHKIVTLATDIETLQSTKHVIMAHELLHAAWRYYSAEKRETLTKEINSFLETLPEDAEVFRRIEVYDPEKSDIPNEYHSFLGTVEIDLSPYLENHYAKYFKNRKNIVVLYREFGQLVQSYLDNIESLNYQAAYDAYTSERDAYTIEREVLKADADYFNANHSTYDRETYERERAALVARVEVSDAWQARLGKQYDDLELLWAQYNLIYDEYRALLEDYNSVYR